MMDEEDCCGGSKRTCGCAQTASQSIGAIPSPAQCIRDSEPTEPNGVAMDLWYEEIDEFERAKQGVKEEERENDESDSDDPLESLGMASKARGTDQLLAEQMMRGMKFSAVHRSTIRNPHADDPNTFVFKRFSDEERKKLYFASEQNILNRTKAELEGRTKEIEQGQQHIRIAVENERERVSDRRRVRDRRTLDIKEDTKASLDNYLDW